MHWLAEYWNWVGSNVGAMPACSAVAVIFAVCFRKPAQIWWKKHFGAQADIAELRELAEKAHQVSQSAHRIVSDLFEHQTGVPHQEAPEVVPGEEDHR